MNEWKLNFVYPICGFRNVLNMWPWHGSDDLVMVSRLLIGQSDIILASDWLMMILILTPHLSSAPPSPGSHDTRTTQTVTDAMCPLPPMEASPSRQNFRFEQSIQFFIFFYCFSLFSWSSSWLLRVSPRDTERVNHFHFSLLSCRPELVTVLIPPCPAHQRV